MGKIEDFVEDWMWFKKPAKANMLSMVDFKADVVKIIKDYVRDPYLFDYRDGVSVITGKKLKRKYYREYLTQCGWGVMLAYDSVEADSSEEAYTFPKKSVYCDSFECIVRVKNRHLHLDDEALSKLYGQQEM